MRIFESFPQSFQVRPLRQQRSEKKAKYSAISTNYWFIPVAVETMVASIKRGPRFLTNWKIDMQKFQRTHESTFLHQRISIIIQRFNSIAFRDAIIDETNPEG